MLKRNHWLEHIKQWQLIGPPLRPSKNDIANYITCINKAYTNKAHPLTVVLLGVTPEIANIAWPKDTILYSVEYSEGIAKALWTKKDDQHLCISNWFNMPFANNTIDIVIGDGCFTTLKNPELYVTLNKELARILKPQGMLIHRFFVRAKKAQNINKEPLEADSNFHAFKWRLAKFSQKSFDQGIDVHDIWHTFKQKSYHNKNWKPEEISTIEVYKNSKNRYTFPSLVELDKVMSPSFTQINTTNKNYTLGDDYPIISYAVIK